MPSKTPQIDAALKRLEPLITDEPLWLQEYLRQLIKDAWAPNSWTELVEEELEKQQHQPIDVVRRIETDEYEWMANQTYDGVDVDALITESEQ